jgi:hypothetical protein
MSSEPLHDAEVVVRSMEIADVSATEAAALTDDQVKKVAAELGVPAAAVAAALAEAQAGANRSPGALERFIGPDSVAVHHQTGIEHGEARELVVRWLDDGYGMRVRNGLGGAVVATKRKDLAGPLARAARSWQGLGVLGNSREVRVSLVQFEGGRTAMCLVADVSDRRTSSIVTGSAVTGAGVAAGAGFAGLAVVSVLPVMLAVTPIAAGIGALVARRRHRKAIEEVREELEVAADGVALGQRPPTLRNSLASKIDRVRSITRRT